MSGSLHDTSGSRFLVIFVVVTLCGMTQIVRRRIISNSVLSPPHVPVDITLVWQMSATVSVDLKIPACLHVCPTLYCIL